jgi:hypothetical protein
MELEKKERDLPKEKRTAATKDRIEIGNMDDAAALAAVNTMLQEYNGILKS